MFPFESNSDNNQNHSRKINILFKYQKTEHLDHKYDWHHCGTKVDDLESHGTTRLSTKAMQCQNRVNGGKFGTIRNKYAVNQYIQRDKNTFKAAKIL